MDGGLGTVQSGLEVPTSIVTVPPLPPRLSTTAPVAPVPVPPLPVPVPPAAGAMIDAPPLALQPVAIRSTKPENTRLNPVLTRMSHPPLREPGTKAWAQIVGREQSTTIGAWLNAIARSRAAQSYPIANQRICHFVNDLALVLDGGAAMPLREELSGGGRSCSIHPGSVVPQHALLRRTRTTQLSEGTAIPQTPVLRPSSPWCPGIRRCSSRRSTDG